MNITGSPDINVLDYAVTWDISGTSPKIEIDNLSSGPNLAGLVWWFVVTSPTGTLIHQGSEANPDNIGVWTSDVLLNNWPRPFNQIEWSGTEYFITLYVKDTLGNVKYLTKGAPICRPVGNTPESKNTFGKAKVDVQVKCQDARIYFEDKTYHSYQGLQGVKGSSTLKMTYPFDETGNIPAPFQISNFSSALVPISYSGEGYQYIVQSVYEYDMGDNVFVRVRYQDIGSFPVWCNVDLGPLVCEYAKLIEEVEAGSCADVQSANQKMMLINPKLSMAMMGIMQPLTGIDVPKLVEEIKAIGGFDCDCCSAPTGVIPQTASVIDGYSFEIVSVCGDISGTVNPVGTNIQFLLQDKSYVFAISPDSPQQTTAFSVIPQEAGCTKTYNLYINVTQLATDILNVVKSDAGLVNLFNSIVVTSGGGGGTGELLVDGGCIFQSTSACDYQFTLSNIPVNTTFALLSGIQIGGSNVPLSFSFNLTNLGSLQTYLNGLGYGTFTVTNPSAQNVLIASTANPYNIQQLSYKIAATSYLAAMGKDCTGYVPRSANAVVQDIIYYLCGIDDSQIVTSQNYEVCYLDAAGNKQTQTVTAGASLTAFLKSLTDRGCETLESIRQIGSVSCDSIKDTFGTNTLQVTAQDFILGTKGNGTCSRVNYLDAFRYMLSAGISNAGIKELFCNFVASCVQGLSCAPYDYFDVLVTEYDTNCSDIVGIEIVAL